MFHSKACISNVQSYKFSSLSPLKTTADFELIFSVSQRPILPWVGWREGKSYFILCCFSTLSVKMIARAFGYLFFLAITIATSCKPGLNYWYQHKQFPVNTTECVHRDSECYAIQIYEAKQGRETLPNNHPSLSYMVERTENGTNRVTLLVLSFVRFALSDFRFQ